MPDEITSTALVVDGDRELGQALSKVLTRVGYGVTLALSFVEAGELLRQQKYGLVLLDLPMQQHSGLELVKYIKEEAPDSQIIVITVDTQRTTRSEALRAGAFAFLSKPFKMSQLLDYAKQALKGDARMIATQTAWNRIAT